jgi:hypothetical protein
MNVRASDLRKVTNIALVQCGVLHAGSGLPSYSFRDAYLLPSMVTWRSLYESGFSIFSEQTSDRWAVEHYSSYWMQLTLYLRLQLIYLCYTSSTTCWENGVLPLLLILLSRFLCLLLCFYSTDFFFCHPFSRVINFFPLLLSCSRLYCNSRRHGRWFHKYLLEIPSTHSLSIGCFIKM